jgi:RimJ/RimL family protein N-acetyltransferase
LLQPADAEALWTLRSEALEREPVSFGESAEEWRKTTVGTVAERLGSGGNESFVFGVFHDSALVGMAGFRRLQNAKERHKGWIWGVYLAPEFRGRGLGRRLLLELLGAASGRPGLEAILLNVETPQLPARTLYLSLGFRSFGVEPRALRVDGRYIDEEHMVLELWRKRDAGGELS